MGRLFNDSDGFDEDTCLSMYDSKDDFYNLVLHTFLEDATCDIENYRILVHGLKGAGGSAGASKLVDLATRSNALIKEGDWDQASQLHEPIIAELERLIRLIPERIDAHNG